MSIFTKVDDVLLKKFQEFSEHKQVTTDKNCYYFAYESFKLEMWLGHYIPIIFSLFLAILTGSWIPMIFSVYLSVTLLQHRNMQTVMRYVARQTQKMPEPSKWLRGHALASVVIFTTLSLLIFSLVWGVPVLVGFFLSLLIRYYVHVMTVYFLSCTPLPPETLEFRRNAKKSMKPKRSFKPQTA